jgi:DNA-binding transcriptional LysR family regulator
MNDRHGDASTGRAAGKLLWMACFVRAVETGSFSAAARDLGIGQPNVSRHIATLEAYLGLRLLQRTTRRLLLTVEGERYYKDARHALDAVDEAESVARGVDEPRGLLRLSCSVLVGRLHVQPLVAPLLDRYPALEIELHLSDDYVDLVGQGFDLAVRIGHLSDGLLVARKVGVSERALFASPAYLAAHGEPATPQDLAAHDCVLHTLLPDNAWPFPGGNVVVHGRYRLNHHEAILGAVLEGRGIGLAPVWLIESELKAGRVKALLRHHPLAAGDIHLLYPTRRHVSARARVMIEAITRAFARKDSLRPGYLQRLLA